MEKNNQEKLIKEEKLARIMHSQVENKHSIEKLNIHNVDSNVEGFLVFKLVCSMNEGNSGVFHGRPEMARRQLDEIQKLGYDLNQIYNSFSNMTK